ncbi:MAG: hypothetical protein KGL90_10180 [Burkholderiales bacterium]|nr:hypothetical protein [Burkholderiales bacterium]
METRLNRLESIPVHDAHGNTYTVHAYERLARVYTLQDPAREWEPTGVAEYKLDTGEHVDVDADGSFRIVETGVHLERKSPHGKSPLG